MGLFNFNKQKPTQPETSVDNGGTLMDSVIRLAATSQLPSILEDRREEWVTYGKDNNFPTYLETLYNSSPTHQAIVDSKALIVAGDSYTYDDSQLSLEQKQMLKQTLQYIDGKHTIEEFINDVSKDLALYGAIATEIIMSLDRSKWVIAKRVSPKHIRSGKYDDGDINEYFYSRNWMDRREDRYSIPAFDINNKEDARQLMYIPLSLVTNEYYGEPSYLASLNWISLESQCGEYYKSLLDNNFSPSMIVNFFRKPANLEEKEAIVRGLKESFGGSKNAGKVIVSFSSDKDTAPEIKPIDVANVDKQFLVLAEQIQSKILTGGRITTPELLGINIPGSLGSSGDFPSQVEAFQKFVIAPSQKIINILINKLLFINGFDVNFEIKPYELTANQTPKI